MNYDKIVYPSSQLYATLPEWITEQYPRFVEFANRSLESDERMGFSQNILQNLEKYRDFDFYKAPIVEQGVLDENLLKEDEDSLLLVDSFGFPDENGVIYIENPDVTTCGRMEQGEVILYRKREGNRLVGLQRGASATTDLGTFVLDSTYSYTEAQNHVRGAKVNNLSVLFLTSMLDTIHDTFAYGVDRKWIYEDINHGTLLERFRDFFQSKGTKLGIQALFKFIFGENDVDVFYPGDQMIEASESTWTETFIMRTVPMPELLVTPVHNYVLPDRLVNRELQVKSYNDLLDKSTADRVIGRAICDYVSSYEYKDTTQYELYIQKNNVSGNFPANPFTQLTRALDVFGTNFDNIDVTTITVETTLNFPETGVIFIGTEGIFYGRKTFNQFLDCKRGFINVETEHQIGDRVYGPYYIEGLFDVEDERGRFDTLISRSWPLGLVSSVEIFDKGKLHQLDDTVVVNGPGRVDPREPIMGSFIENYDDKLIKQASVMPYMRDNQEYTAGVSGIYFDAGFVFVTSTNYPYHTIGNFSIDYSVGPYMETVNALHVIPRRDSIKTNLIGVDEETGEKKYFFHDKGFREIGVCANGVPFFSNVSNDRIVQGKITKYEILGTGFGYKTPTLLVDDKKVEETIELDDFGIGRVLSISTNDNTNYDAMYGGMLPKVEVIGGRNGEIQLTFDRFGRCLEAEITNPGEYYYDVPSVQLVDSSFTGKGGNLVVTVTDDGQLESVTVLNPGLDYKPATTKAVITPVGGGAEIMPVIQYYQFDRVGQVNFNPYWTFDEGNGFLWPNGEGPGIGQNDHRYYGYVCFPLKVNDEVDVFLRIASEENEKILAAPDGDYILATPLGTGSTHSPLLGYAFDGNPIYGGRLYANGVDMEAGLKKAYSGWTLRKSRSEVIPSGGNEVATMPPSEQLYPMGTFVEDYVYNPSEVARRVRIMTEEFERVMTEEGDFILASTPIPTDWVLNENNAVKCNTPEYPKELYPDGVWVYVATEVAGEPQFPYIIGKTFEDRPISQNVRATDDTTPQGNAFIVYNPRSIYTENAVDFNINDVERFRNPYLKATGDEVILEIANIDSGSISEIVVVDGQPSTSKVGDRILFDNNDTGGSGAAGIVSELVGVEVVKGEGKDITTTTISHYQRLNLRSGDAPILDEDGFPIGYTFVEGSLITCSSGAEAAVTKFDTENQVLDVYTYTKTLIQPGDSFRDNKGRLVTLGEVLEASPTTLLKTLEEQTSLFSTNNVNVNQRNVYFAHGKPADGDLQAGDLWWSEQNGRLYIYYNDGDSSQWVCTQPIGMRPLAGASDTGIGTTAYTDQIVSKAQEDLLVTISTKSPDQRSDGSPNREGDLWWSSHTGILYMYINEWVCTDPNAIVPTEGASDTTNVLNGEIIIPNEPFETAQTVIISYIAPIEAPDGGLIVDGMLWWSPLTGKMYIRYTDMGGTSQWVITNPVGILSSTYSLDYIPDGDGGNSEPPVGPLPIDPGDGDQLGPIKLNKGESIMWFEHLKDFDPGDTIRFMAGAPGTGSQEDCVIKRILEPGAPTAAVIQRGSPRFEIPDGCNVLNISKSLYIVTTTEDHQLRDGDKVTLSGSAYDEINDTHVVVDAGQIVPATGTTQVANGEVTSVTVTDPGRGYFENFYVTFYGGGGTGGYAYVEVDQNTSSVKDVTVLAGGVGYTSSPEIYWGTELKDTEFEIYLKETYPEETGLSYHTSSINVISSIHSVEVDSPGIGYTKLPRLLGVYKKAIDRAQFTVELDGTSIRSVEKVDLEFGGTRYESPIAYFYDIQGSGTGASAKVDVKEGKVVSIDMIDGGTGYVEPAMILVENKGKFIALTDDIGEVTSIKVVNPGRAISPDRSLKPEIMIDTRVIVEFDIHIRGSILALNGWTDYTFLGLDGYSANSVIDINRPINQYNNFQPGDQVYQGMEDYKLVTATVIDYDNERQILTLRYVEGNLKEGEYIYNENGAKGMVLKEGQTDARCVVNGISSPEGRFIDDTSIISSSYAHLQDSYYYQHFSYSIQSPLQQHQFDDFVQSVIHPAGFVMFSDLQVNHSMIAPFDVSDAIISGPVLPILTPDNYNVKYTAIAQGEPTVQASNPALSPDVGTVEFD